MLQAVRVINNRTRLKFATKGLQGILGIYVNSSIVDKGLWIKKVPYMIEGRFIQIQHPL